MAIQASTIFSRVRSFLDDDNSTRYTEADDLVPAINSAINYLMAVFSAAFEQRKIQPEVLSELIEVLIYNPDVSGNTARIELDDQDGGGDVTFSDIFWTIIGVDPNPTTSGADPNVLVESTQRFAHRLTVKEWNYALENPFSPGYSSVPSDFQRVAYTGPGSLLGDSKQYIFLRPGTLFSDTGSRVAVWILKKHPAITAGTTELLFPVSLHELIVQKTLYFISYQHKADSRYSQVTDKEVKELITLMNL
jgi:hypothetical protein